MSQSAQILISLCGLALVAFVVIGVPVALALRAAKTRAHARDQRDRDRLLQSIFLNAGLVPVTKIYVVAPSDLEFCVAYGVRVGLIVKPYYVADDRRTFVVGTGEKWMTLQEPGPGEPVPMPQNAPTPEAALANARIVEDLWTGPAAPDAPHA